MKPPHHSQPRGMALVIVLVFIVLLAALVVGLFTTAQMETVAASTYEAEVQLKHLAASATGIVTGQILDGTRSAKGDGAASGRLAWASQPGLIRTWDALGGGGRIFKLYSARDMVAETGDGGRYSVSDHLADEVPESWPGLPAQFVDLNEPVLVEDGAGAIVRGKTRLRASYPIMDPLAALPAGGIGTAVLNPIESFTLGPAPGFKGRLAADADPTAAAGSTGNAAAMPVRWIYVLRDGTFTVPTGSAENGRTATWKGAAPALSPSRANPIVGRVAFWADDETCKLNVNTASEPTPWDTPRAISIQDLNYGKFQPAQREYQRFPGHPLSTALSPVFFPGIALNRAQKESIYTLLPRVQPGGTEAATVATTAPVTLDRDRLYANVDEFLFRPEMPSTTRVENTLVDSQRLRRARFFLTANSRAPELNLFGGPRISLWPVDTNRVQQTGFDRLSAFCSTIGTGTNAKPFYFQRGDAASPTADFKDILRNRQLYTYLQRLTAGGIPGYGGTFVSKWGQDRDQVLTEIFDYIRSTNLRDALLFKQGLGTFAPKGQVTPIQIGTTQGFGRFYTVSQAGLHFICSQEEGTGILASNKTPNNKLSTGERLVNVAFLFEPWSPALGFHAIHETLYYDVQFAGTGFTLNGKELKMRSGGKVLDNQIGSGWHNNGREHGGSGGLRGPIQDFGAGNYQWVNLGEAILPDGKTKVRGALVNGDTMNFVGGNVTIKIYAAKSADSKFLVQTLNLSIPGGTFPAPKLVRTGTADYRGGDVTTAAFWWTFGDRYSRLGGVPHAPGLEYADPNRRWTDSQRVKGVPAPPGFKLGGIFREEDVVRSIVPEHGDIRLIAAKRDVPATDFVKVRAAEWENVNDRMLHIFSSPAGSHFLYGFSNEPGDRPGGLNRANPAGGTFGGVPGAALDDQLTSSPLVKYHYSRLPEIRPGAGRRYNQWNDYDNGVSTWPDGAYINKPDEGNFASTNSPYTYFAWNQAADSTGIFFSPSRLVPSAGMLGSLPTGVLRNRPWETLLFRPEVRKDAGGKPHPGTTSPKDHLLMDLFWMPVIEPWAISEPFSTGGKVNLNYEIAPFSYIRRATALHGVMKSEEPLALPNAAAQIYKLWDHETNDHPYKLPNNASNPAPNPVKSDFDKAYRGLPPFDKMRRAIDVPKTLSQADTRFAAGNAFRSATEICELHLVREGETLADYERGNIWPGALLTGDNTRERPYTNLYGRLTTRSNTFTIHLRVQALRSAGATDADWTVWREDRVQPLGEYRGSSIIERYIDPADPNLQDFALVPDALPDAAYRIRILSTRKFTP